MSTPPSGAEDGGNGQAPSAGLPAAEPPQRVSGMRLPQRWTLPGRPAELDGDADDAWRQSGFLLAEELALLTRGFGLQLRLAATGYQPAARTMTMAALASQWSRALSAESEALSLLRRGGYGTAVALVRQAVEFVAAQIALGSGELDEFRRWAHHAYERHEPTRADDVGLGHYFAGEAIAGDENLRLVYRAASDLARPNFGATALFVAGEAGHSRYPLIFGDQAFHLGWGQLLSGWLAMLGERQIHLSRCTRARSSPPTRSCAPTQQRGCGRPGRCGPRGTAAASRNGSTKRGAGASSCSTSADGPATQGAASSSNAARRSLVKP